MSFIAAAVIGGSLAAGGSLASGAMASSSSKKALKQARELAERQARIAGEQGAEVKAAGGVAQQEMSAAGQETPTETERLGRYTTAAKTPGETLLQQAGPISQAVARRIQERVDQPGLDYNTQSADFAQGVTTPLWQALKARGIAPPPGSEGGGLGTQQYMKGAAPALAELRSNQINTDINRGQTYGASATQLNQYYQELENALAEAIRQRLFQSGIYGAEAKQRGITSGAAITSQGAAPAYASMMDLYGNEIKSAQTAEESAGANIGDLLSSILSSYQPTTKTSSSTLTPTTGTKFSSDMPALVQKRLGMY